MNTTRVVNAMHMGLDVNMTTEMPHHMDLTAMMGMNHTNMTGMDHDDMGTMDLNVTGMDHGHSMHDIDPTVMPGMDHEHSMHDMDPTVMPGMGHDHSMHGMDPTVMIGMDHDHSMHGMDPNEGHIGHGDDTLGHHAGHQVYFNFEFPVIVLFLGWRIDDRGTLAGSCVGVLLLTVVYEALKTLREHLYRVSRHRARKYLSKASGNGDLNNSMIRSAEPNAMAKMFNGWHLLQSLLHIIQTTLGMFLMLVYMTFNVWLALSVSLGSGLGYLLFSWNKSSFTQLDDNHCI